MTAAIADRNTQKMVHAEIRAYPLADNVKVYKGTIAVLSAGYMQPGSSAPGLIVLGRSRKQYDNTISGHTLGGITGEVEEGIFKFANGDSIAQADVGKIAYVVDDSTVAKGGNGRSRAGQIVQVDADGVWVSMFSETESELDASVARQGMTGRQARFVATANVASLAAFAGVTGGTPVDGISGVQGDYVLLAGQTSKAQNGLYQIGVVAAGVAPLTRPIDFASGTSVPAAALVEVSEGTLFNNTSWKLTTAGGIVAVDTTVHDWYPGRVTQLVTLIAGTVTVSTVPILSATKTSVAFDRTTPNTSTATTGGYNTTTLTPGVVGTASLVFQAQIAAGTINNADVSGGNLTFINW